MRLICSFHWCLAKRRNPTEVIGWNPIVSNEIRQKQTSLSQTNVWKLTNLTNNGPTQEDTCSSMDET